MLVSMSETIKSILRILESSFSAGRLPDAILQLASEEHVPSELVSPSFVCATIPDLQSYTASACSMLVR